jgi:hypothetical protein
MSLHVRRLSIATSVLAMSVLAACGGGGEQQNLAVSFDYGSPTGEYPLWVAMDQEPTMQGLDGHTPKCEVISGSLPDGITVGRDTCKLSGSPAELGEFNFTVRLSVSGFSGSVTADGHLTILPPTISYMSEPLGQLLVWKEASTSAPSWYGYQPAAGDVVSNFHVEDSELPVGLSIDANTGVVSGTFKGFGVAGFTIHATITHNGQSINVSSGIIEPLTSPPSVAYPSSGVTAGRVGQAFTSVAPLFSDNSPISDDYTAEFTVDMQPNWVCDNPQPLPAGLTLNSATGVISGTPTESFDGCVAIKYEVSVPFGGSVAGIDRAPVSVGL